MIDLFSRGYWKEVFQKIARSLRPSITLEPGGSRSKKFRDKANKGHKSKAVAKRRRRNEIAAESRRINRRTA